MKLDLRYKGFLREKNIRIDTRTETLSICGDDAESIAGRLMRFFIDRGSSVIIYGNQDFYPLVHDIVPSYIATIDYKEIVSDCGIPYIKNSSEASRKELLKCFEEYDLLQKFNYMANKKDVQAFYDPTAYKSFYQIKKGNIEKEQFYTETLLVNMLSQTLYQESLHEVTLFLPMPYKPMTKAALSVLERAQSGYINLVCLYKDIKDCNGKVKLFTDSQNLTLEAQNRRYKITNEELQEKQP